MAYIGKSPVIGNFVKLDAITAVNGQAAYTMQNGGSNFTDYESVNQFLVSLNGTIQAPTDSFTVSGSCPAPRRTSKKRKWHRAE